ncbi:MAG: putative DNA binding domain-containing protein [Candidatus Omnitrophica bacterium]|nr:putative DNA binding domain-containing protein [Candidatus Omnitrophota bacterium]
MRKEQLLKRLSGIEWDDFEVKAARVALPEDIAKAISAFANTTGGYIAFGVQESGSRFIISGVEDPDKIQNDFVTLLRGEKFNIPLSSKGDIHHIDGKVVLVFRIEEMPRQAKPVYFGGDIRNTFVRIGASTQKASKPEVERMLREASEKTSDSMRLEDFGVQDLDDEAIGIFRRNLELKRPGHPFLSCDKLEMLVGLQAVVETKKGKYCLTAGGLLLFGKEIRLQNQFPSYFIDFLVIPGLPNDAKREMRWVERYSSEQSIVQTFVQINDRLRKRVPFPFSLKADGMSREDDPPSVQAAREALVNLLMHMDYFDAKGAVVKCYDDRMLFRNAGSLRFPVERIGQHITEPRNPIIAKVFRLLGWAESTGEGITKITDGWMSMGYDKPVFNNDKEINLFEVTLPLTSRGRKVLRPLLEISSEVVNTGTKPALSWHQVSTKLALSRDEVRDVLDFCAEPKSIADILKQFERTDRTKFKNKYINPLLREDLLLMTHPQKPNSPNQKYVATDTGKHLLANVGQ